MKNSLAARFRCWRARRCGSSASARHSTEPCNARGKTAPDGTARGQAEADDATRPGARAGETCAGGAAVGEAMADAMRAAIGLLTASLDSPELEAWALPALIPKDADGLGELLAGLHLISELLIHELHEATGEPPQAILQRLAILAEYRRGMPSSG
jgi:hypothetical protein